MIDEVCHPTARKANFGGFGPAMSHISSLIQWLGTKCRFSAWVVMQLLEHFAPHNRDSIFALPTSCQHVVWRCWSQPVQAFLHASTKLTAGRQRISAIGSPPLPCARLKMASMPALISLRQKEGKLRPLSARDMQSICLTRA